MHIDFYKMLVIQGPSLESVECPAGYRVDDMLGMKHYDNKSVMVQSLIEESNDRKIREEKDEFMQKIREENE